MEGHLGELARLAEFPDPRKPRGRRHSLVNVLALAACAVLTRATSLLAISEWAPMRRRRSWTVSAHAAAR